MQEEQFEIESQLLDLYVKVGEGDTSSEIFEKIEWLESQLFPSAMIDLSYSEPLCNCAEPNGCWECACKDNPMDI